MSQSTSATGADATARPSGFEPEYSVAGTPAAGTTILLLGATGYIGGRLLPRLLNAGYRVRVLTRSERRESDFGESDALEVIRGDATDAAALEEAMAGVDVVYHLIHSMTSGLDFVRLDRKIAHNVADAAEKHGVKRIVYLGGLAPEIRDLSPHMRSRREVERILARTGVALTFRAGVVIGSGSASFEMIRHLTEVLPVMPAPRWVRNRIQPIAVRDVLHYLLAAPKVDRSVSGSFDIGGPDDFRYDELMNGYAAVAGLPARKIWALPVLTPGLASHWVGLVTPVPSKLAKPLVGSLQHECVMRNHDIDAVIPPPAGGLVAYRDAVELAMARMEIDDVETSWVDAEIVHAPSDPLPSDPDWAGRTVFVDRRSVETSASAESVWRVIIGIGGENGWYSPLLLWAIRGWLDRAVGGVGLRRGRRNRSTASVGDAIDFWRVEEVRPGELLRLRAEMKIPGRAWLELSCHSGDPTTYRQRAIFFPKGLSGRLYWWAVFPFHGLIFAGMAKRIVAIAEAEDA